MGDSFSHEYCIHLASLDKQERKEKALLNKKTSNLFQLKNTAT